MNNSILPESKKTMEYEDDSDTNHGLSTRNNREKSTNVPRVRMGNSKTFETVQTYLIGKYLEQYYSIRTLIVSYAFVENHKLLMR